MATGQSEKTLELKVGAFVLAGLAVLAILVIQFGRVGEGFKTYYGLTVDRGWCGPVRALRYPCGFSITSRFRPAADLPLAAQVCSVIVS